jgi:hypothetical protein
MILNSGTQIKYNFPISSQVNYLLRTDTKIVNVFLESYKTPHLFSMSSSSAEVPLTMV